MDLGNILNQICEEIQWEAINLSKSTWESDGEKLGYLSHFLEQHITSVIAYALRRNYSDYVIVEMPYYYLDINYKEWGNERADFYAYDGRKGSGTQIIGEVKLGGPERSNLNTPSNFLKDVLWDLKKLWSIDQTERYVRVLVAVWEGPRKESSNSKEHPKTPKKVLQRIYKWLDSGWNDTEIPEFNKFIGNRPTIGGVMSRMIEMMKFLEADFLMPDPYIVKDRIVKILSARF